MKITKRQLKRIIKEEKRKLLREYRGTEAEDARFTQDLEAEKDMKAAGLTGDEIAQMWPFLKGTADSFDFMDTSMYEKLFNWFVFDGPPDDRMPYGTAKARDDMPDEWILDRLAV